MKKRVITVMLVFALLLTALPFLPSGYGMSAYAASKKTKKATAYNEVIKHGNTVYCRVFGPTATEYKIYKVNLKTGKKKKLDKSWGYPTGMIYKSGYLYYTINYPEANSGQIKRVNVKTGKKQKLANTNGAFVISGKTIYYTFYRTDWDNGGDTTKITKKMSLDGKNKKKVKNIKVKVRSKNSNTKGYKLVYVGCNKKTEYDEDGEVYSREYEYGKCYLQKPNGKKKYICKVGGWLID